MSIFVLVMSGFFVSLFWVFFTPIILFIFEVHFHPIVCLIFFVAYFFGFFCCFFVVVFWGVFVGFFFCFCFVCFLGGFFGGLLVCCCCFGVYLFCCHCFCFIFCTVCWITFCCCNATNAMSIGFLNIKNATMTCCDQISRYISVPLSQTPVPCPSPICWLSRSTGYSSAVQWLSLVSLITTRCLNASLPEFTSLAGERKVDGILVTTCSTQGWAGSCTLGERHHSL